MDTAKLAEIQSELKKRLEIKPFRLKDNHIVAGIDATFSGGFSICAAVLMTTGFKIIEKAWAREKTKFPYIPGFLSFREGPVIEKCFAKLKTEPDLIVFDGQGIAHPKGFGLASHMGIILDKPSIGAAKSRLVGKYKEPGLKKGKFSDLFCKGEKVGAVLRTRDKTKPLFVSPGHKTDIKSSVEIILKLSRYRICEPTRQAHIFCGEIKRKLDGSAA